MQNMPLFFRFSMVLAVAMSFGSMSFAQTILTVHVKTEGKADKITSFSREELAAMGMFKLTTANDYLDGEAQFEGVLMRNLLAAVAASGAKLARLIAENDYSVEISTQEFFEYDVLLAMSQDGERLSLRDKGPIWMIYPMSDFPELQDPSFNSRLIWQLDRVELE